MKRLVCYEPSDHAIEFYMENAEAFAPVKKLTSFFDTENFLLTNYSLSSTLTHTVIENVQGDTMEFSGLICGYGGKGPRTTSRILQLLGIPENEAENLILYDGLQITFEQKCGSEYSVKSETFFNGNVRQKESQGLNINQYCRCNVITRDVYFINPEQHSINRLLDCLHIMEPFEFEYIAGKDAFLIDFHAISEFVHTPNPCRYPQGTHGVNLIIRGNKFDVKCFIDHKMLYVTLNAVYCYLTKSALFEEKSARSLVKFYTHDRRSFFGEMKLLLCDLRGNKDITHEMLPVSDKELKRHHE